LSVRHAADLDDRGIDVEARQLLAERLGFGCGEQGVHLPLEAFEIGDRFPGRAAFFEKEAQTIHR
jgi:hypothetical protein